jgi:hypothetical protein
LILQRDTPLSGHFARSTVYADVAEVLQVIDDAREQKAEQYKRGQSRMVLT